MTHGQMDDSSLPPSCCVLEQIPNIQTTEHHDPLRVLAGPVMAAAFLDVASAAFSAPDAAALAFAISSATLVVSAGIAYYDRASVVSTPWWLQ